MVPARIARAAERFRKTFNLPDATEARWKDYVDYHDAIHQLAEAPPTDEGENVAFEIENAIFGRPHNYADWHNFNRRYGHLFIGMRST